MPPPNDPFINSFPQSFLDLLGFHLTNAETYLVRIVETYDEIENGQTVKKSKVPFTWHFTPRKLRLPDTAKRILRCAQKARGNVFISASPRSIPAGGDHASAIRKIPVLFADLDHVSVAEALARCVAAGVPKPTSVITSGSGVHLRWLLREPYLIDDAGPPVPMEYKRIMDDDGEVRWRPCWPDPAGGPGFVFTAPPLSPKARHMLSILMGLARAVGGDACHDLARVLRMLGTLNRKNERNGRQPIPCEVDESESDNSRVYALGDYERFIQAKPTRVVVPGSAPSSEPSAPRSNHHRSQSRSKKLEFWLVDEAIHLSTIPRGSRSEACFSSLCKAVLKGVSLGDAWAAFQSVPRFSERGYDGFVKEWTKAERQAASSRRRYDPCMLEGLPIINGDKLEKFPARPPIPNFENLPISDTNGNSVPEPAYIIDDELAIPSAKNREAYERETAEFRAISRMARQIDAAAHRPAPVRCGCSRFLFHPEKHRYAVLRLFCGRWKCYECAKKLKVKWCENLENRLRNETVPKSGEVIGPRAGNLFIGPLPDGRKWGTLRKRFQRQRKKGDDVEFVCIQDGLGEIVQICATVAFEGATEVSPAEAWDAVGAKVRGILIMGDTAKPIHTSKNWHLPVEEPAGWKAIGPLPATAKKNEVANALERLNCDNIRHAKQTQTFCAWAVYASPALDAERMELEGWGPQVRSDYEDLNAMLSGVPSEREYANIKPFSP